MKIDLEKVEKANIEIETVLALIYADYKDKVKVYPGDAPDGEEFANLLENGYIVGNFYNMKLTNKGQTLLSKCTDSPVKFKKNSAKFKEFWSKYPLTDRHGRWAKTRTIRTNRPRTEQLFWQAVSDGEATPDELILAMEHQAKELMKSSITSNKLTFMKGPAAWLGQKEFENILADMKDTGSDDDNWTETIV